MTSIHDVIVESAVKANRIRSIEWKQKHLDMPLRLFVSDIGKCPRAAYLSAIEHTDIGIPKTHPPDRKLMELFGLGNESESATWKNIKDMLPVKRNVRLDNGIFSGKIDFLVDQCEEFPRGAIFEHKGTSHWNFSAGEKHRLPYKDHCLQVLMYQKMMRDLNGIDLPAYLYYRVWNMWAQFKVEQGTEGIWYEGKINGSSIDDEFRSVFLEEEIEKLTEHWLPEAHEPPTRFSPFEYQFDCATQQKATEKWWPRCSWFSYCWQGYPEKGPLYE